MITVERLTYLLYKYDPMNTSCRVYKSFDEYEDEAHQIIDLLELGIPFKQAYFSVMSHMFWVDWSLHSYPLYRLISLEYYNNEA